MAGGCEKSGTSWPRTGVGGSYAKSWELNTKSPLGPRGLEFRRSIAEIAQGDSDGEARRLDAFLRD